VPYGTARLVFSFPNLSEKVRLCFSFLRIGG